MFGRRRIRELEAKVERLSKQVDALDRFYSRLNDAASMSLREVNGKYVLSAGRHFDELATYIGVSEAVAALVREMGWTFAVEYEKPRRVVAKREA